MNAPASSACCWPNELSQRVRASSGAIARSSSVRWAGVTRRPPRSGRRHRQCPPLGERNRWRSSRTFRRRGRATWRLASRRLRIVARGPHRRAATDENVRQTSLASRSRSPSAVGKGTAGYGPSWPRCTRLPRSPADLAIGDGVLTAHSSLRSRDGPMSSSHVTERGPWHGHGSLRSWKLPCPGCDVM